ncbi:MAG: hypothetical protein WCA46_18040 [Actinocatenispora sp.]
MIDSATERRAAGDWPGACRAARVTVAPDLTGARRRYGPLLAGRVEADLTHLAPDLLRWHFPRSLPDQGVLVPGRTVVLAGYPRPTATGPGLLLVARSGTGEHLTLDLLPGNVSGRFRFDLHRHLWDARHTDELRIRCGGSDRRTPFFEPDGTRRAGPYPSAVRDAAARTEWLTSLAEHADTRDAWQAAGLTVTGRRRGRRVGDVLDRLPVQLGRLLPETRGLLAATGGRAALLLPGHGLALRIHASGRVELTARGNHGRLPLLPEASWRRLPDLDLLRRGELDPDELHPLVHRALFPQRDARTPGPPAPAHPRPVRVRCALGARHRLATVDGALTAPDHPPADQRRERLLARLGGPLSPCLTVTDSWRRGTGPTPVTLARMRLDALEYVRHADSVNLLRLLDEGLPATVPLADGATLLHALAGLDHRALLPRLGAALPVDARDGHGRNPLYRVVSDGADAALVDALLDLGADPGDPEVYDSAAYLARTVRPDLDIARGGPVVVASTPRPGPREQADPRPRKRKR